jgi:excisionase family DNA binding protein
MTITEAAEYLGLKSTSTLRMQIARGALAAELVGKTYIIKDEEVERYRKMHLHQQGKRTPAPGRKPKAGGA